MSQEKSQDAIGSTPLGYDEWRHDLETYIERSKRDAVFNVNRALLSLYWHIGNDILEKNKALGWGAQVIKRLPADLTRRFPDDRGYSERNLKNMRRFAAAYPDFPYFRIPRTSLDGFAIGQASLAQFTDNCEEFGQVALAQISWYHHISLLSKVKDDAQRAFYIVETVRNGWSRDVMMMQIDNGYINAKGRSVNNFSSTLPPPDSDLARYVFKDPYNFSFLGTVALQNELDIERTLTTRITDFLLEMGRGFAFIGRQYHLDIGGDDYYIDILMYHLKLHCYVVVKLKAVEFIPEFVSKPNFYISAVDEYVKSPEDKPTIGLLLCRTKNDKKAEFALRGITQPMGIAAYETEKLFAEVASALPQINEIEIDLSDHIMSVRDTITDKLPISDVVADRLTDIYLYVESNPNTTSERVAEGTGIGRESVKKYLRQLSKIGLLLPEGKNRSRTYKVNSTISQRGQYET